jgi:hypothetical protein
VPIDLRPNKPTKKRPPASSRRLFHAYDCPKQEQVGHPRRASWWDVDHFQSPTLPRSVPARFSYFIWKPARHSQVKIGTIWSTPCVFTNRKIDRSVTNNQSIDHWFMYG